MNRAFTCQQPKKGESDALGSVPRWWFNGIVGSCQQFLFDPTSSDVSPNNFETLDHCESYCKDSKPILLPNDLPNSLPSRKPGLFVGQEPAGNVSPRRLYHDTSLSRSLPMYRRGQPEHVLSEQK